MSPQIRAQLYQYATGLRVYLYIAIKGQFLPQSTDMHNATPKIDTLAHPFRYQDGGGSCSIICTRRKSGPLSSVTDHGH
ncbi:hypothetical protein K443DRAFT_376442 [Laccaria amethystina LaAM-08-1]|uniref:Uncharacterized protein n=1 Tax=Laccaria amethystina LaAM-08-1 TaxID=1095629 RepID=A0A0C9WY76_9AGAR|nr:hypothetical protein K443DRAFT_376442 [Laccaria amethystina LaAM-08-1]